MGVLQARIRRFWAQLIIRTPARPSALPGRNDDSGLNWPAPASCRGSALACRQGRKNRPDRCQAGHPPATIFPAALGALARTAA
jgi:hypothetical protein